MIGKPPAVGQTLAGGSHGPDCQVPSFEGHHKFIVRRMRVMIGKTGEDFFWGE
jgi:hypothetical protein